MNRTPNIDDELREQILTEFKQVHKLAPADYTENCTNVVMSMVSSWHKAEIAKLFEQIRSEVIGDFDAHKAMKPQTMRIGNNGQIDHEWTDQDEYWKTIMTRDTLRAKQLEALTRLEEL